jgi:hypothetical protein
VPQLGEPYWLEADRAKVIAYVLERALQCPMCGTSEWEHAEDPNGYEAVFVTCPGCAKKDRLREESEEASTQPGTHVQLIPAAVAERLRHTPRRRPLSPREKAKLAKKGLRV